jgi:LemA protein
MTGPSPSRAAPSTIDVRRASAAKTGCAVAARMLLCMPTTCGDLVMSSPTNVIAIARVPILASLLGLLVGGCGINNIPTFEETAKARWSDVESQYQRRAELIPNLVEAVKGYAAHERQVLEEITNARARATQIQVPADIVTNPEAFKRFQEAQAQLTGALGRLLAVVERYPDLKANQNFLALQSQLEGTENRIAVARRDYIDAVREYNTELRTFPGLIWASTLYRSAKPMETFTVPDEMRRPPQVKF